MSIISLSIDEKKRILDEFPSTELSYENIIHKKVYSDIVLSIPQGRKYFAWFKNRNNMKDLKDTCYMLQIGASGKVVDVIAYKCCFSNDLKLGTIFYGTIIEIDKGNFYSIEDIIEYKGENVFSYTWQQKFELFHQVMKFDIKQVAYNKSYIVMGLPIISNSFDELLKEINQVQQYHVKYIQFRKMENQNVSQCIEVERKEGKYVVRKCNIALKAQSKTTKRDVIFTVRATLQNDIYLLYEKGTSNYVDVAFVSDYKTSVMMNKLFRTIKENFNLDALEESDDEEEFENNKEDRFVFLEREIDMVCAYNSRFKKWMPSRVL